jgi:Tfp pilus assembly protein PilV
MRRRATAAYTAVEVLMSLAVLAVGVIGIIAGEKVTLASNQHSKNLAIATHIAESWMGMLDAEAALWTSDGALGRTTWLNQGAGLSGWFRPNYNASLAFGPGFDALGNPVTTQNIAQSTFCADLRLTPLTTTTAGGGMVRAEVRVIWQRNDAILGGTVTSAPTHACGIIATSVGGFDESRLFHFVYMSSAVRQVGQ